MIRSLVKSAFQTGWLSVASEGLIRQVLSMNGYQSADLEALAALEEAVNNGTIQREASWIGATRLTPLNR
ncbi:MAG: hypothetical protein KME08_08580 [Aphanothece sp. CMT-3BRIN-NPC111]|jgi:uncharacterized ferritin-like protein (DUF455 family)|nr:hypothetical protein [Aphanothece sp. CMT-3BRIN-NPC111]